MSVSGELVDFYETKRLPKGAKRVARVTENLHTFYEKEGQVFMRDCVGNLWEIGDPSGLSYKDISYDFEAVEDWCPRRKK